MSNSKGLCAVKFEFFTGIFYLVSFIAVGIFNIIHSTV
jgi:hypothetical protein